MTGVEITLASVGKKAAQAAVGFGLSYAAGRMSGDTQKKRLSDPNDLKVTANTYGQPIPRIWGKRRISGNVIWLKGNSLDEKWIETGGGKKGKGGKGKANQGGYIQRRATFAVSVCEGPATITKIWADTNLIYDYDGTTQQAALDAGDIPVSLKHDGLNITVYLGNYTQLADPRIEADVGVEFAPAYRGVCYVVVDDMNLEEFGNRLPNFSFEAVSLADNGPLTRFVPQNPDGSNYTSVDEVTIDPFRPVMYRLVDGGARVQVYDLFSKEGFRYIELEPWESTYCGPTGEWTCKTAVWPSGNVAGLGVDHEGNFYRGGGLIHSGNNSSRWMAKWDPNGRHISTTHVVSGFTFTGDTALVFSFPQSGWRNRRYYLAEPNQVFVVEPDQGVGARWFIWPPELDQVYVSAGGPGTDSIGVKCAAIRPSLYDIENLNYDLLGIPIPEPARIGQVTRDNFDGRYYFIIEEFGDTGFVGPDRTVYDPAFLTLGNHPGVANMPTMVYYTELTDAFYTFATVSGKTYVREYGQSPDTQNRTATLDFVVSSFQAQNIGQIKTGSSVWFSTDQSDFSTYTEVIEFDLYSMEVITTLRYAANDPSGIREPWSGSLFSDDRFNSNMNRGFPQLLTATRIPVATIIGNICERSDLLPSDYDASLVTADCMGYFISDDQTADTALRPLLETFNIAVTETDGILVFRPLNLSTSIRTLTDDDYAVEEGDEEDTLVTVLQIDQTTFPKRLDLEYTDPNRAYDINVAFATRDASAFEVTERITLRTPVLMDFTEAQNAALKAIKRQWSATRELRWATGRHHADLAVNDVVTVQRDGHNYYDVRITEMNFADRIGFKGITFNPLDYGEPSIAQLANITTNLQNRALTELFLVDSHLIRSADDDNGFYLTMSNAQEGSTWFGGVAWYSADQAQTWQTRAAITAPAAYGYALTDDIGRGRLVTSVNVSISGSTFTRADGVSWVHQGFTIGQTIITRQAENPENIGEFVVTGVTATALTVDASLTTNADDTSITFSVQPPAGEVKIDEENELTISFASGIPPTGVIDNALNYNWGAFYQADNGEWEIVRWASTTDNGDGTITLNKVIRGSNGTEHLVTKHRGLGLFLVMDFQNFLAWNRKTGDVGLARYWYGVTIGQEPTFTGYQTFTNRQKGLEPWSVALLTAVDSSGDLLIDWYRRTRHSGSWGPTPDIPLNEEYERFEVEIQDTATGAIIRGPITVSDLTAYTYTTADRATDSTDDNLTYTAIDIVVWQISAAFGRGVEKRITYTL